MGGNVYCVEESNDAYGFCCLFLLSHSYVMHMVSFVIAFSASTSLRILMFGVNMQYDFMFCGK